MSPYLTERATRQHRMDIPLLVLLAGLVVLFAYASIETFDPDNAAASIVAGVLLTAAVAWPGVRILRRRRMQRDARHIAQYLDTVSEATVSVRHLQDRAPIHNLERRLDRLIQRGYLQNVHLDLFSHIVTLIAVLRMVEDGRCIQVECPSCGATNQILKGRVGKCEFCDSPIIVRLGAKPGGR